MGWQPYPGNGSSGGINSTDIPNPRPIPFSYIGIQDGVAALGDDGLVPNDQLPPGLPGIILPPTPTALGGLFSKAPAPTNFATGVDTSGNVLVAQPSVNDIQNFSSGVIGLALPIIGGQMQGPITLVGDPVSALQPATQQYVDARVGAIQPVTGIWNATTNTPTLTAGVGTPGQVYLCTVAGTQSITGSSVSWQIGDQAIFTPANVWQRAPFSSAYVAANSGTATNLTANNLNATSGNATGMSALALLNAGTIAPIAGISNDAFWTDANGFVISELAPNGWNHSVPVIAPSATLGVGVFGTTTANLSTPLQTNINVNGTTDTIINGDIFPGTIQPLAVFLDANRFVANELLSTTGELDHQSPTNIAKSVATIGRFKTRLTSKLMSFGASANVNSTVGTTYRAVFTLEGQPTSVRFLVPSSLSSAVIGMQYAFTDTFVNDGNAVNPTIGGQPSPWTTCTFTNNGLDVDYFAQRAALNAANMVAPTTFTLPVADTVNYSATNPLGVFHQYLTDHMPGVGPLRIDGGNGATVVIVDLFVVSGTLQLAQNTDDANGDWDQYLYGRDMRSYSQVVNAIGNPSAFTSTTRTGLYGVQGVQYESVNRGIQLLTGGDSTWYGTGTDDSVNGSWRQIQMAFSSITLPCELAITAQPASDYYTFALQMGNFVDIVKPSVAGLQAWSRNSWKTSKLVSGPPGLTINGWQSTLQILLGGTITVGNTITITITDTNVTGSPLAVPYTVQSGDTTLAILAASIAAHLQATSALFNVNYRAFSLGNWVVLVNPAPPPSNGVVAVSGGATVTATGYFNYYWISQNMADNTLAAALAMADKIESYGGVSIFPTAYGDIGNTLLVDQTRQKTNTTLRAMASPTRLVADYDVNMSLGVGPAGAPQIPVPQLSPDGVHPNEGGYKIEYNLLNALFASIYDFGG